MTVRWCKRGLPPLNSWFNGLFVGLVLFVHSTYSETTAESCKYPGSPAHSTVEFSDESLGSSTIATYTCERGFELLGPHRRICENGVWLPEGIPFCGLTAMCMVLRRLTYPNRLSDISPMFGLSPQSMSQIIGTTINIALENRGHLLENLNHLGWLNRNKMRYYSQAILNKGGAMDRCWAFLDGTKREICRPGIDQQEYYSGHSRSHCLKYQSLLTPDGMVVSLKGAWPGRRHDAGMFRESRLYEELEEKAVYGDEKFVIYADQGYGLMELLITPFAGRPVELQPDQLLFNNAMKILRVTVEWGFQKIISLFAFLDFKKNQKLLLQDLESMYKVGMLLTNCHTCLYGSQVGHYFLTEPPTMNEYFVLNVAAGKAPMQVSTEDGGIPQKAIDGSTSAFFNEDTCTLTKPEKTPWWYVNLLEPYMVQLVRLDFGKPCCGLNKPATIVVRVGNNRPDLGTNPICNRFTGFLEEGQPLFLPCNPPMPGAFVSVHLEVPTAHQLSICEAFVYTDQALPIERCPQFRDQPPGSTATYNGKCYVFYNRNPMKFRDALQFCRSRGGTLVDESNPALQGFISWELWRRHRSDSQGQYWMGVVRDQQVGGWQWLKGDEVTVSFWNLPVGSGNCARYDGSKGWLWSDTDCNRRLNYICQHQPKACGRPEQPPNSTMLAPNFDVGSVVEYSCNEGHLLVGPTMRTCLETGFYNEFPPVCKRIQCGYPADIPNGEYSLVNDSVGYLSRVVYSCFEGYEMIGRAQLACDIDERWNGPPPRCEPVQCEPPQEIPNAIMELVSNETLFGTEIPYMCENGYVLVGPSKITCMANGQYDSLPPSCEVDPNLTSMTQEITQPTKPPTSTTILTSTSSITTTTTKSRSRTPRPPPTTIRASNDVTKITTRTRKPQNQQPGKATSTTITGAKKPAIIIAGHPQDNEIAGTSNNIRHGEGPNVNVPLSVDEERREPFGARLNIGAIIALGAFGAFIFLAAIITTVVILVRRNQSAKHYRHRASPDCNTVASFDSSSSESRHGGLNRYYRQAWENLHESAGSKSGLKPGHHNNGSHSPLRRKETMDEPYRARDERHRDTSEMVVGAEKKRHHHHHHHHGNRPPPNGHKRY